LPKIVLFRNDNTQPGAERFERSEFSVPERRVQIRFGHFHSEALSVNQS
jgi:hypothetical protein